MPRRTDISKILIIGSGPIIIGQSAEFDYSGTQACKALKAEGYEVVLANSNPATIMTDPEIADRTYIEPLTREYLEEIIRVEREMSPRRGIRHPADGWRTDRAESGDRTFRQRHAREVQRAADRRECGGDQEGGRPSFLQRRDAEDRPRRSQVGAGEQSERRPGVCRQDRLPGHRAAVVHAGRQRRRHRLQPRRDAGSAGPRARFLSGARSADRRIGFGMEGIRTRGDARPQRQRHHHLLDRELRSHGRAYRRFDHRRSGADAYRPRISGHARCRDRGDSRDRRRDRRIEYSVWSASRRPGAWSSSR